MKIQTKKEVKDLVGSCGFNYRQLWSPYIKYVYGVEDVDLAINEKRLIGNCIPIIRKAKQGYYIILDLGGLKSGQIGIPYSLIESITYQDLNNKNQDNEKVVTSAVVGKAIGGNLGAVAGALTAMSLAEGGLILSIKYKNNTKNEVFKLYIPLVLKNKTDKYFEHLGAIFVKVPV